MSKSGSKANAKRKPVEEGQESEDRFRILADDAPVLIWVSGPDGCDFVNLAYLEFVGVSREVDVLHFDWSQFVHPDDRDRYLNEYLGCFRRQVPFNAVLRFRRHDGVYRWMKSIGKPRYTPSGEFYGFVGSTQDITDIKLLEDELLKARSNLEAEVEQRTRELRASEVRYRELVEHANSIIMRCDRNGRITFFNEYAQTFFGYSLDEIIGKDMMVLVPATESSGRDLTSLVEDIKRTPERYANVVNENIRKNGERVWVSWTNRAIRDECGNVAEITVIGNDITERKQAEELIAQQANLLSLVGDGVWAVDAEFKFTYWNKGAERILGYTAEEALGKNANVLLKTLFVNSSREENIKKLLLDGHINDEVLYQHKAGHYVAVEINFSVVKGPDGMTKGLIVTGREITERKRAEEALRESKRTIQVLMDSIPESMALLDRNGIILAGNTVLSRRQNVSRDKLIGSNIFDSIDPDIARLRRTKMNEVFSTGKQVIFEDVRNGRYIQNIVNPVFSEDGQVSKVAVLAIDITERRQAGEALAAAYRQFQSIIDNTPDIVYAFDLEERFVMANAALAELFNSTPEQMMGKRRHEFMPGADADWHEANDRQAIEAGRALEFEEYSQLGDRSITWLTKKFPLRDGQGRIYAVAGISVDITERKRAEKAIRESEARRKVVEAVEVERKRLFGVLETIPAMVCLLTPDYRIAFANRSFYERFGESRGRHCYEYCWGQTEPCEFCESFVPLKTGKPHHWEVNGPDGSVIEAHDYPFTDVDGSRMILEMDFDITGRRRVEMELEKHRKHLEDLVQERTQMLAEAKQQAELYLDLMGHDISNMHQIILGQLQMAEEIMGTEGNLNVGEKELIDTSIKNLLRSAKLIDNVKNLQKLRVGEFSIEPVDLDEVLNDAVAAYSHIPDKHVTIDYTPAHGHVIMVNPVIKEVFNNLIDNGVKHSGDPVRIGIEVSAVDMNGPRYHRVAIEDNGPGIPDEKKEEVFHRLRRGQTKARGTGLGLYLVKTLVESFGGMVELEDRVGGDYSQGCRFIVYLPAVEEGQ